MPSIPTAFKPLLLMMKITFAQCEELNNDLLTYVAKSFMVEKTWTEKDLCTFSLGDALSPATTTAYTARRQGNLRFQMK